MFHPVTPLADGRLPSATADKSGAFTIRTYPYGEGAPEGEYTVITTWLKSGPGDQVRNQLPARYADAAKTPVKVSVKPGPNVLEPFRLTKAP